jgi:hypothetical protein
MLVAKRCRKVPTTGRHAQGYPVGQLGRCFDLSPQTTRQVAQYARRPTSVGVTQDPLLTLFGLAALQFLPPFVLRVTTACPVRCPGVQPLARTGSGRSTTIRIRKLFL